MLTEWAIIDARNLQTRNAALQTPTIMTACISEARAHRIIFQLKAELYWFGRNVTLC